MEKKKKIDSKGRGKKSEKEGRKKKVSSPKKKRKTMSSITRRDNRNVQLILGPITLADGQSRSRFSINIETEIDVPVAEWPAVLLQAVRLVDQSVCNTSADTWPELLEIKQQQQLITMSALDQPLSQRPSLTNKPQAAKPRHPKKEWKTQPCRFGASCRGEDNCFGYHGEHDRFV